jgi:NAD(P) transhydrogenase
VAARTVLLATGSRPARPAGISFEDPDVYDSDEIYAIRAAPSDVVIAGGGAVGVEFATVFTALGVPVTLVSQAERLLSTVDAEIAALLTDDLARRGVRVLCGTGIASVRRVDGRLTVCPTTGPSFVTGAVLVASGRSPNTEGLGLAAAGVEVDTRGRVVVDRYYRTSAAGVCAAGDVVGAGLASTAMQQGRAAACHACGLVFGAATDELPASAVCGMPEVAGVGMTEDQARAAEIPYATGRCDLATTTRGVIAGRGGLLKLVFRADDRRLLGVHCMGEVAAEVIGLGHVALHSGWSVERLLALGLNTPTYGHAYHDAAVDGLARLARLTAPPPCGQENPNVTTPNPPSYRIRIAGHLGRDWSAWLGAMNVTPCDDGTTRIVGSVVDSAALYGLLAHLRDLGATLLEVERLDNRGATEVKEDP